MADMEIFYEDLIIINLYVQAGPSKMPCLELLVEPYMTLLIEQTVSKLSYPLDTSAKKSIQ